jgi:hypothetical protein
MPTVSQWKQRIRRALIRFGDWQTTLHVHLCSQCRQELPAYRAADEPSPAAAGTAPPRKLLRRRSSISTWRSGVTRS